MKFELTTKTIHSVTITDLEQVSTDADVWRGLKVDPKPLRGTPKPEAEPYTDEDAFQEEWLSEVTRTAVDMLWMHDRVSVAPGEYFYLGHFDESDTGQLPQVVVISQELDTYGQHITYNGWRVRVRAEEVEWGLD